MVHQQRVAKAQDCDVFVLHAWAKQNGIHIRKNKSTFTDDNDMGPLTANYCI
jgi:hypothetical protein